MESEFEPDVRTEETSKVRIVKSVLPGFRREDLRLQVNNGGSLVISGERGVKEMEMDGMTKVGGRLEKMQGRGNRFRKVISVPENLNFDGITAKFGGEKLRVSLPLVRISNQQNQDAVLGSGKIDQSLQSKVEKSSSAGKQETLKEQPAQDDQSARHPEAIRREDDKEKPTVAAEESNELLKEKKAEAPKQAEDLAEAPPISTHAQTVSEETGSAHLSESIQSKSKQDDETLLQEDGGQKSRKLSECRYPPEAKKEEGCTDNRKPAEKSGHVFCKEGNGEDVGNVIRHQEQEGKNVYKSSSPWRTDRFPYQKRIHLPASCSSMFSERGVMIASTVLVLSIGLYITYRSRSRHRI